MNNNFPDIQCINHSIEESSFKPGDLIAYSATGCLYYGIFKKVTKKTIQFYRIDKWLYNYLLEGNKKIAVSYIYSSSFSDPSDVKWRVTLVDKTILKPDYLKAYEMMKDLLFERGLLN